MGGAHYVFILGTSNDDDGTLSAISLSRVDAAERQYRIDPQIIITATGSHGAHFNSAVWPHRHYVDQELIRRGIPTATVSNDELLSSNTVEDALVIDRFCKRRSVASFGIATSAFHVRRCEMIFDCLCPDYAITFHAGIDPAATNRAKIAHEVAAQTMLRQQGGVMVEGKLFAFRNLALALE